MKQVGILIFLLIIGLFWFGKNAKADYSPTSSTATFTFDNCAVGAIQNCQAGWDGEGSTTQAFSKSAPVSLVITPYYTHSLRLTDAVLPTSTEITINLDFLMGTSSIGSDVIALTDGSLTGGGNRFLYFGHDSNTGFYYLELPVKNTQFNIPESVWGFVSVNVNFDDNLEEVIFTSPSDGFSFTATDTIYGYATSGEASFFSASIGFIGQSYTPFYIDNLSYTLPFAQLYFSGSGYGESDFLPIYPVDGRFNQTTYDTSSIYFTATGWLDNMTCNKYDNITIELGGQNASNSTSVILFASSTPATSCSPTEYGVNTYYSKTVVVSKDNYRVAYKAEGLDQNGDFVTLYHYKPGTAVGWQKSSYSASTSVWWGNAAYLDCQNAYQNCINNATGSLPEQWIGKAMCGVQGVFWSMFCPSPAVLDRAKGILADARNRFPINLIDIFPDAAAIYSSSTTATGTQTTTMISMPINQIESVRDWTPIQTVRNIIGWIMWILILIWVIRFIYANFLNH